MDFDILVYQERRKKLVELVKQENKAGGAILLFSNFENSNTKFKQESSFRYFTGVTEPGSVLLLNLDESSTLFVPNSCGERAKWLPCVDESSNPKSFGINQILPLGEKVKSFELDPFFKKEQVKDLILNVEKILKNKETIFVINPENTDQFFQQKAFLSQLSKYIPELENNAKNILPLIAKLRCNKSKKEIEYLYKAIEITSIAQSAAAEAINPGVLEADVAGTIEYVFTASKTRAAFPSIVGSGKNSTVLHYNDNDQDLKKNSLVIVDIGADYNGYSADLTRTYPVSGKFTKRQREVYNLVLETQLYISSIAKPGIWLKNSDKPEESLHHLAKAYLEKHGYAKYFTHGLGHYLGMDTHDIGDYSRPLQIGDVFTIEPGIYIPEEEIGIRIEDDYWIVEDGVICLSEDLPKYPDDIEAMVTCEGDK